MTMKVTQVCRKFYSQVISDAHHRKFAVTCGCCGGLGRLNFKSGFGQTVLEGSTQTFKRSLHFHVSPFQAHVQLRKISTSKFASGRTKDYYREDKLPIFDYGKVHEEKKRLYVFGQAAYGALGLERLHLRRDEDDKRRRLYMQRPSRHPFAGIHQVRDIAAGQGFTLISVKPKKSAQLIFGCGNNSTSQLGYQPSPNDKPLVCLISIVPLALPLDMTSNVLALGAGRGHSLISVAGKGLISLGDNSKGQCGRKIIPDEQYMGSKYICRIPPLGSTHEYDVIQIASRLDVSICLTRMGKVYTFGGNEYGQLGRGKVVTKQWIPGEVEGDLKDVRVKKVVTSGASVLAVSEKGELFGWGSNDCGHLNPETLSNIYFEPVHIKLPRRVGKIIDVAVGSMFSYVLNEHGNLYVWGMGKSLGLGPKTVMVKTPTLVPPPLFGRNEFSSDVKVVKIDSSFHNVAAVNSIGDLYTWGKSVSGCLGLGNLHKDEEYQHFPLKVALGAPVHKLSLGTDHTVIITKGA